MVKIFYLLNIIFLNLLLTKSSNSILQKLPYTHCLVYIQSFNDFVNFEEPPYVIHASCKFCIVYKVDRIIDEKDNNHSHVDTILPINGKFNSIAFACIGEGYDESLTLTKSSSKYLNECYLDNGNKNNMIYCTKNVCCCRGFDCHDKLKNKARLGITNSQDQKCFIERQLLNINNPILQNEYNSYAYMNYHCTVCGLILKETYFETLCIEENDVEISCGNFKNFVGGKLACNNDGTNCCCRDNIINCTETFRNYAFNNIKSLGKPLISSPYTKSSNILLFNWFLSVIFINIYNIIY